jgi:lipoprotein-anchoring transpeptidase ErfK/SrfK
MLPRLVVVDRAERMLELWEWRPRGRYKRKLRFPVTVGKAGSRTQHGLYFVGPKSRRPDWNVPEDDDYPRELWGTVLKFGEPGNPFSAGFISLVGKQQGIGLHGTSFDPRVGTASSHGCIRLRDDDLLSIYDRMTAGTPVYLH